MCQVNINLLKMNALSIRASQEAYITGIHKMNKFPFHPSTSYIIQNLQVLHYPPHLRVCFLILSPDKHILPYEDIV